MALFVSVIEMPSGADKLMMITFRRLPSGDHSDLTIDVESMRFNVSKTFVTETLEYIKDGLVTWSADQTPGVTVSRRSGGPSKRRGAERRANKQRDKLTPDFKPRLTSKSLSLNKLSFQTTWS